MQHNLTKLQRAALQRERRRASLGAMRKYFTGEGSAGRCVRYFIDAVFTSAVWLAKLMMLASWAVLAGLLIGPEYQVFLQKFHSWMVATPFDQLLAQSKALVDMVIWKALLLSAAIGVCLRLADITNPAIRKAEKTFLEAMPQSSM
jgi:hypothetical protein